MIHQAGKLPPALVAGLVLSIAALSLQTGSSHAADECLGKPRGETPAGGHWYYYVDKSTGRHCWYLAADGAARSSASNLARRASHPTGHRDKDAAKKLAPTVANARAELQQADTLTDQDAGVRPTAPTTGGPDSAEREPQAETPKPNPLPSVLSTRWPEVSGVAPSAASAAPAAEPAPTAVPAPVMAAPAAPMAAATTAPVETATTVAPPPSDPSGFGISASQQILLAVIIGVLALWRLSGSALYRSAYEPVQPQPIPLPRQPRIEAAPALAGDLPPWLMRNVEPAPPPAIQRPALAAPVRDTSPDRLKHDLDDNLQQLRTLIAQLKQDAQLQR